MPRARHVARRPTVPVRAATIARRPPQTPEHDGQELKVLAGSVDHRADLEPFGLAELLAQFQGIACRGLPGEEVIGDRPQREDAEMLATAVLRRKGHEGHVRGAGVIDHLLDVDRAGDFAARNARRI